MQPINVEISSLPGLDFAGYVNRDMPCLTCGTNLQAKYFREHCNQCSTPVVHSLYNCVIKLNELGHLDDDFPCSNCSYNLRKLHFNSLCPECGHAITESISSQAILMYDHHWLGKIARGYKLIFIGTLLMISNLLIPFTAPLSVIIIAIGIWLCATPNKQFDKTTTESLQCQVLRTCYIGSIVSPFFFLILGLYVSHRVANSSNIINQTLSYLLPLCIAICSTLICVTVILFLIRTDKLAHIINAPEIQIQTKRSMFLTVATLLSYLVLIPLLHLNLIINEKQIILTYAFLMVMPFLTNVFICIMTYSMKKLFNEPLARLRAVDIPD